MKVFKFGGASVKDIRGIQNLASILKRECSASKVLVVISAMGKTTNALENVVHYYINNNNEETQKALQFVKDYHNTILEKLFEDRISPVYHKVNTLFNELSLFLESNRNTNYDFVYDQTIIYGELLATYIVSYYLNEIELKNNWLDARNCIKTDSYYRTANIDWESTQNIIRKHVNTHILNITQGFIGSDANHYTTTLGREGSDYSAAIFAYCLDAESVTIWKDVPGVLNADPRYFEKAELLHKISYEEAIELAFYGASVIHPKTLQPLQRKKIPLQVRSFLHPEKQGTVVGKYSGITPNIPCYIVKKNQILIALSSLDFSYIVEENISAIFKMLHDYKMKVGLIQNSAISFCVCLEDKYQNINELLVPLRKKFKVKYYQNASLYTIRHYDENAIVTLEENKTVLLKQLTQETVQIVTT